MAGERVPEFTHIENDAARMVDITRKDEVARRAVAKGWIMLRPETLAAIMLGTVVKGNVLATARVAAILAVKETSRIIPMCHPIPVGAVKVGFETPDGKRKQVDDAFKDPNHPSAWASCAPCGSPASTSSAFRLCTSTSR